MDYITISQPGEIFFFMKNKKSMIFHELIYLIFSFDVLGIENSNSEHLKILSGKLFLKSVHLKN